MKSLQLLLTFLALIVATRALLLPKHLHRVPAARSILKRKGGDGAGHGVGEVPRRLTSKINQHNSEETSGKRYFPGGSTTPYRAGARSPGGITPVFMPASNLDFYPGLGFWTNGVYIYQWSSYTFKNSSTHKEYTLPVDCLCGRFQKCGCDEVKQRSYINSVAENSSISQIATINRKQTLILQGTLPNGTTVASGAVGSKRGISYAFAWLLVAAGSIWTAWLV